MPIVAWYMLSKESYMNRVIKEVLPTLCSPRNTSLNFFKGLLYEPPACAMFAVVWSRSVSLAGTVYVTAVKAKRYRLSEGIRSCCYVLVLAMQRKIKEWCNLKSGNLIV
jgi:hypothetical protein